MFQIQELCETMQNDHKIHKAECFSGAKIGSRTLFKKMIHLCSEAKSITWREFRVRPSAKKKKSNVVFAHDYVCVKRHVALG